jgi:hypothetical protein
MISIMARDMGEPRLWVGDQADPRTCRARITDNMPAGSTWLYTDAWQSSRGSHPAHATVRHGIHEWARDADGEGRREVHGHTCEGAGAALRTSVRAFRGVHKRDLPRYVATSAAMVNAQRLTPALMRRLCLGNRSRHGGYT